MIMIPDAEAEGVLFGTSFIIQQNLKLFECLWKKVIQQRNIQ